MEIYCLFCTAFNTATPPDIKTCFHCIWSNFLEKKHMTPSLPPRLLSKMAGNMLGVSMNNNKKKDCCNSILNHHQIPSFLPSLFTHVASYPQSFQFLINTRQCKWWTYWIRFNLLRTAHKLYRQQCQSLLASNVQKDSASLE